MIPNDQTDGEVSHKGYLRELGPGTHQRAPIISAPTHGLYTLELVLHHYPLPHLSTATTTKPQLPLFLLSIPNCHRTRERAGNRQAENGMFSLENMQILGECSLWRTNS